MAEKKQEESLWDRLGKSDMNSQRKTHHQEQMQKAYQDEVERKRKRKEASIWDRLGKPDMNSDLD